MNNSHILAFDFGMKYIGVAVGQTQTYQASPVGTIKAKDGIPNWDELKTIIEKWDPHLLIVGLPLNMDGTKQELTNKAKKFANRLKEKYKIPIELVDENLTSWEATNITKNNKDFDKKNAAAAVIILEDWLFSQNN